MNSIRFIIDYWRGNLPLKTSLILIFISLLVCIHFIEPWLLENTIVDPQHRISLTFLSLILTKCIIFPWQLVGLLRASDKDYLTNGNTLKTRLIQLLMVLSIAYILSYSISLIQSAIHNKKQQELSTDYINFQQKEKHYKLSLRNNAMQLVISGELEIGITKAVSNILKKNPQISSVALNSFGGHIYEGRGLSKLFTRQSLNTYVYQECSSACTSAFSGGLKRYLGVNGKLGFHQYKHDLNEHKKSVAYHDATAEQERDLKLFLSRGIDPNFLEKIFNESSDSMWFPTNEELITAKMINGIIE